MRLKIKCFIILSVVVFVSFSCKKKEGDKINIKEVKNIIESNCDCINENQADSIVKVPFSTKGSLSFFWKNDQIRRIKALEIEQIYYDEDPNITVDKYLENPNFREITYCVNKSNQLVALYHSFVEGEVNIECFNINKQFKEIDGTYSYDTDDPEYFYTFSLIDTYIYLSKLNHINQFPEALSRYSQYIYDDKSDGFYIAHPIYDLRKDNLINLYDPVTKKVVLKEEEITFDLIREIHIENNGDEKKVFLPINYYEEYNEGIRDYDKKEYLINLTEIQSTVSFPD